MFYNPSNTFNTRFVLRCRAPMEIPTVVLVYSSGGGCWYPRRGYKAAGADVKQAVFICCRVIFANVVCSASYTPVLFCSVLREIQRTVLLKLSVTKTIRVPEKLRTTKPRHMQCSTSSAEFVRSVRFRALLLSFLCRSLTANRT